jgi:5-methylcytosine-specific restriction endonuclease McrA
MLREAKNAVFSRRLTLLGWRYELAVGEEQTAAAWRTRRFRALCEAQRGDPVPLVQDGSRVCWLFEDRFYWDDEELTAADVLALVREKERRRQRRLERAHAGLAADGAATPRREPIPREVRLAVFQRDGGRCVECDSAFDIQYDHVIPVSMGGATTVGNLQILCSGCNQRKGATLR